MAQPRPDQRSLRARTAGDLPSTNSSMRASRSRGAPAEPGVENMLGHAPPPLTASGLDMRGGHPAEISRSGPASQARFSRLDAAFRRRPDRLRGAHHFARANRGSRICPDQTEVAQSWHRSHRLGSSIEWGGRARLVVNICGPRPGGARSAQQEKRCGRRT